MNNISKYFDDNESTSWPERRLTRATLERYGVVKSEKDWYFPYHDKDGALVATKVRNIAEKKFHVEGEFGKATLFGQHLYTSGGKYVTVTEGECFHPDTEVLTPSGWVTLKEWDGQPVMTGNGLFETPLQKVEKHYEGMLVNYSSGSYRSLVTPEHNMVRIGADGRWMKTPARQGHHLPIPRVVLHSSVVGDIDAQLQVMLSADFTFRKEGDLYGCLKKERKAERAKQLLDAKGVRYSCNPDSRGYHSFFIHRGHGLDVSKLFSYERDLPKAATIIDEIVHWDGNKVPNRDQIEYSTKELHNATFIQTCAHLCGYVSTIIRRSNAYGSWYKVSILFGKQTSSTQKGYTEVPYVGNVNCLTVPSGTLLVRWKESISVSGNCDALAAFQATGSKWPCVSIRSGASNALKDCRAAYEWLDSFETIVICFDNDEPGRKAAKEVAELFGNKAKVFKHDPDMKDACDYTAANKEAVFVHRWWSAEPYIPDGIIAGTTLWDLVSTPPEPAQCLYPWDGLNALTNGIRYSELVTITAGSGLGKSQVMREIAWHVLCNTDDNLGFLFMEESIRKTGLSLMSIAVNKPLHLPDTVASAEERKDAFERTLGTGRMYLFEHFGSHGIENIVNRVRYMAKALSCKYVFLDHLSILVSSQENGDERKAIDEIMTKLRMLVQETSISLFIVSHLKRPDGGRGHEEGASPSLAQLRGSGSIAQLSDMVIGLERNGQADDPMERNKTRLRVLKNRWNGETGPACYLLFNKQTGRMLEVEDIVEEEVVL